LDAFEKGNTNTLIEKGLIDSKLAEQAEKELKTVTLSEELKNLYSNMAKELIHSDDPWSQIEDVANSCVFDNKTAVGQIKNALLKKTYNNLGLELTPAILKKYSAVIEHIILPAAREALAEKIFGKELSKLTNTELAQLEIRAKRAIVFEDLGVVTAPVKVVFNKLNLPGIIHARYSELNPKHMYRERNNTRGSLIMVSGHDDASYYERIEELAKSGELKGNEGYLYKELFNHKKIFEAELNPTEVFTLKFARMLLGSNNPKARNEVGGNWFDLLLGEPFKNIRYNTPGKGLKEGIKNWSNRMPKNWETLLFNKLIPEGKAVNPLRAFRLALVSKKDVDVSTKTRLMKQLEKLAKILEEKVLKI
jgi:hypothetical protein